MTQGDFLASIDIRDAYLHIPIFPAHQRFLRFVVQEQHFQFTALPFGLSTAPRVFTKVMATVMASFLQSGLDAGLALSSLKGQVSALSILFQKRIASRSQLY
ncbi:uncharacterized protein ACNLHF_016660 [Anomaloglossus baeobatrachus]